MSWAGARCYILCGLVGIRVKMRDEEIAEVLARATKHIMEKTGDTFEVAVAKAKVGFKEYIRMRVDAMHALIAEGYSEEYAFTRAKALVNLGVAMVDC